MENVRNISVGILCAASAAVAVSLCLSVSTGGHAEAYVTDRLWSHDLWLMAVAVLLLLLNLRRVRWGVSDILLLSIAALYCISAECSGNPISGMMLQEAFPYAVLYLGMKVSLSAAGKYGRIFLFGLICLWSCLESLLGLSQVFGHSFSRHSLFGMTGSFSNPGPYGGFIAVTMAVALAYLFRERHCRRTPAAIAIWGLACLTVLLGIMVLPASMSRAGWIALCVSVVLYAVAWTGIMKKLTRYPLLVAVVILLAAAFLAGVFFIKKDSALGRLHIWNMEVRAMCMSPFIGSGPGTGAGAYGIAQEAYFRDAARTDGIVRVAGCPEYAFNEYLHAGVETGFPGLLLSIAVVAVSVATHIRARSVFAYGLAASGVFAFFSYPLSVPQFTVLIVFLLSVPAGTYSAKETVVRYGLVKEYSGVALSLAVLSFVAVAGFSVNGLYRDRAEAVSEWKDTRQLSGMELYSEAAEELDGLYSRMRWNSRYLYDYGYALHKTGEWAWSNAVLKEGAGISSDPMFHNIIGKNLESMGRYDAAAAEYLKSHYMVPCRIYPLTLLMDMYIETGCSREARDIGKKIWSMPVNPKNRTMAELKESALERLKCMEAAEN